MKIVCISDTHNRLPEELPPGDLLIHAGDATMGGTLREVQHFLEAFSGYDFGHKIFVAGNHDWLFEKDPEKANELLDEFPSITYLNDSGVEIEGFSIWGSPVQPWFGSWAFNRDRGADIQKHWDKIPKNTDILITHGPVWGILDIVWHSWNTATNTPNEFLGYKHAGCQNLLDTIRHINPKLHVCGHIHSAHGQKTVGETTFVNASLLDESYSPAYNPIVIELERTE